jgi:restriction system protein
MVITSGGTFETEIHGESHYQAAIADCVDASAVEQSSDLACHAEFNARLVREPENRHDANAVAVTSIGGRTLGYLPRELAISFAPTLDRVGRLAAVESRARAYGRRDRPSGSWNFGIWLDLPGPADFAEALGDLDRDTIAEMGQEGGLVRVRDEDSGALAPAARSHPSPDTPRASADYDDAGEGLDSVVAVACPACGSIQDAARGGSGFRCGTCHNDVWIISCHRCHEACKIYGSAVGSGAVEFRCGKCRAKNTVAKQALRTISADARRAEKAKAAHDRATAAQEKLSRARYAEDRQAEATRKTAELETTLAELGHVLVRSDTAFAFSRLKAAPPRLAFSPQPPTQADDLPVLMSFLPPATTGLGAHMPGAKRKHQVQVEEATAAFEQAEREHAAREADRVAALTHEREAFEAKAAELEASVARQHDDVDELENRFAAGDPDAVTEYYAAVLSSISLPYDPPEGDSRLAFSPQSRQLVIELELPTYDVIPQDREYRYIKTRDEIKPMALPATERKRLYASLIAQVALAALRAAFRADTHAVADTIVLNGHVHTIDKRTGQHIHPCLLTVRTTRERFEQLNLELVDPTECLKGLTASVSKSPSEMLPVRPVLDFDMVDPRFVSEENVLGSLDTRPNLMDLTPSEFESLITNLFEKMGLETRLTQASRDGGVDCVAYDARPIFGGKVVIQAKRYKNTVGVSAVRDLFGTMQNEGATKGILVATSGYGQASHEFANGKPLELIDGGNLLFLLQEHAGIEAKIEVPEDWVDPEPPS